MVLVMTNDLRRLYVGHGAQIVVLDREFERVARGEFRCVLVDGVPGIGKTRLATEFLRRKRTKATGLRARGHVLGSSTAFGLWAEAFDNHLRGRSVEEIRRLCGGLVDDLAGLLRSAAATHGSWRSAVPAAHLSQGLATLLANMTRERPVIVVLDDAHLADASSWDALSYLANNLSGRAPVLVLVALRLRELAQPSAGWRAIVSLEQSGLLARLEVPRLETAALRELSARALGRATPPPPLVDWLEEQSRGNPLFAVTLLDALLRAGADPAAPRLDSTPRPLTDWIRLHLDGLDDLARETIEILAVAGRETDLPELRRLAHHGPGQPPLEGVLAGLEDAGLVLQHPRTISSGFQLSHELVQETIYDGLDAARRRAVHRRIARALETDRPHEAALHFARAAVPGDAEAIGAIVSALARAWAQGTVPEAFEILGVVADLIPSGDRRWLDVLDALPLDTTWTTVYNRISVDFDAGIRVFREIDSVLADLGDPDPVRAASVQLRLAGLLGWGRGEIEQAATLLDSAAASFARAGQDGWSLVARNELSWMHALAGRYRGQAEESKRTIAASQQAGDAAAELLALGSLGNAEYVQGRFDEAESALRRSIALARSTGDERRLAYGLSVLGWTLGLEGRLREGLAVVEEARALRPPSVDPLPLAIRTQLASLAGDHPTVRELGARVLSLFGGILRAFPATWLSVAAVEDGDLPLARHYSQTSSQILTRRLWMLTEDHEQARGLVSWADGHPAEAVTTFRAATATLLEDGALPYAALLLVDLAEAALDAADPPAARWAANRSAEVAGHIDRDHYRGLAALAAACATFAEGDTGGATTAARDAMDYFGDSGYQTLEARSLTMLGRALPSSERRQAMTALRQAADLFTECGAAWRRDRVLVVLDGLGKPGQRAAAAIRGPASLTAREREVAGLAAQGLTAKDIGAELHIGIRTVETHIGHAYAKLGVRSRLELARVMAAAEGDLEEPESP